MPERKLSIHLLLTKYMPLLLVWNILSSYDYCSLCSDPSTTVYSDCSTGDVRLNGTRDDESIQGRVEVCINNAWGTVCNNGFHQEDAETVCVQLGGFRRNGMITFKLSSFLLYFQTKQINQK